MTDLDLISPDNYKVIRRIGVGAMGNAYEVEHKELGVKWESVMAKLPCRVKTKKPNIWGVYDIVGQGRTICSETATNSKDGKTVHLQLGLESVYQKATVGAEMREEGRISFVLMIRQLKRNYPSIQRRPQ